MAACLVHAVDLWPRWSELQLGSSATGAGAATYAARNRQLRPPWAASARVLTGLAAFDSSSFVCSSQFGMGLSILRFMQSMAEVLMVC